MNAAGAAFGEITAEREEMLGVAVEGQSHGLTPEEGWALLASLRDGVERISRLMVDAASELA